MTWGTTAARELRVAACASPPNRWNGYAGGFYVREPSCVPIIVRVGQRSKGMRFGIGRSC